MGGDLSTRVHKTTQPRQRPGWGPGRQASIHNKFDRSSGRANRTRNLARSLARLHRSSSGLHKRWLLVSGTAGGLAFTIDLDGAFEVRSILDHDARRRQVADYGAIFFDFDTIASAKISFHASINDHLARHQIGGHLRARSDGQLTIVELN